MSGQHHEFSPSRLGRLAACPGSYAAERGLPDTPSEAAAEGTQMHAWMEQLFRRGRVDPDGPQPTDDQRETLDAARERALALVQGDRIISVEARMALHHWSGLLTEGTADLVAVPRDGVGAAVLVDYKFGRVPVTPQDARWQLGAYAAMIMQRWHVDAVEAYIVQPRVAGGLVQEPQIYDSADSVAGRVHRVICACRTPGAPCVPDPDRQCRYCKAAAAGTCPAARAATEHVLATATEYARNEGCDLRSWDDDRLVELVAETRLAARLAADAEAELRRRVEASPEGEVCGWRLESTPGRRKADPTEAWRRVAPSGITPEEYMACCDVSLPRLEALYAGREVDAGRQPNKAAAKRALGDVLGDAVTRGDPAMRLAHK